MYKYNKLLMVILNHLIQYYSTLKNMINWCWGYVYPLMIIGVKNIMFIKFFIIRFILSIEYR